MNMNVIFGALIGTLMVIGLACGFLGPRRSGSRRRAFAAATPGLLVSLGVFGTFLGILRALLGFDVTDIDGSVPQLLAGMRVAFWSSVLGMGSSLFFRGMAFFFRREEVVTADPLAALGAIREGIERQTLAIAGDGEESLASQVRRMRTDSADASRDLRSVVNERAKEQLAAFDDFAEHMVENTHGALIEALGGVVRDFNDKLTEQFGENFKQLNEAVGKLVGWQEAYREQMDRMEARLEAALSATEAAQKATEEAGASLATIEKNALGITDLAEELKAAVDQALAATRELAGLTGTLASLQDQATRAFPVIEDNLTKLTNDMTRAVAEQSERIETAHTEAARRLDESAGTLAQGIDDRFEQFDSQAQQAVGRVIDDMGTKLASISGKLTEDYGIIIEAVDNLKRRGGGRLQ